MKRIALISAPWPLYNRPSIQLGALKAYVQKEMPEVEADAFHLYLSIASAIGYGVYEAVSTGMWRAEAPYAALLFPEMEKGAEGLFLRKAKGTVLGKAFSFKDLCMRLKDESMRFLDSIAWDRYLLVGLSVCLGQLTSSLFFASEIKKRSPKTFVVLGGSACASEMGKSLERAFPFIDRAVSGEGERKLVGLIRGLGKNPPALDASDTDGLLPIKDMDSLPIPDFSDYFEGLARLKPSQHFVPRLPLEGSRGCWWQAHRGPTGSHGGCSFCNLNLQWIGYRKKTPERIKGEIAALVKRHRVLSLSFMDNSIPPTPGLFEGIKSLHMDLRLFCEVRSGIGLDELEAMARAGVREIQGGIESLSSSLLKKLNKGVTAMDNIEMMRNCERTSTPALRSNLIMEFPSSDEQDIQETLDNMEFALPFAPPKGISFWLGYDSPVWRDPAAFGISRTGNHPLYRHLFPSPILDRVVLMLQGYRRITGPSQRRLWAPVRKRLSLWKKQYTALRCTGDGGPLISHQDAGDFMIIRCRRRNAPDMIHRLEGASRGIYLFCQKQRPIGEILSAFPGLTEDKLLPFLRLMNEKRLIFIEAGRCLSLSLPASAGSLM
jgi:ribosomal peptide maturation radical SAM protein 1